MSNDSRALSDVPTGQPKKADYDAVYAALMATERGRWFLAECASRNRHADTHMIVGAIARLEAAIRGKPVPQARRDLIGIAAAIDRINAEIAAGETSALAGFAAVERIQDVAFMLHDRGVEPTLCAALDAAVRETSEACARSDAAAKRTRRAAEMLRALGRRVGKMMALPNASPGAAWAAAESAPPRPRLIKAAPQAASEDEAVGDDIIDYAVPQRAPLFGAEGEQAENLARAVAALAALAAASRRLDGAPEPTFAPTRRPADQVQGASHPANEMSLGEEASVPDFSQQDSPSHETAAGRQASEASPSQRPTHDDHPPSLDLSVRESERARLRPSGAEPGAGPEEDPGDLFGDEVRSGPTAAEAAAKGPPLAVEMTAPPPVAAGAPPSQAVSVPAASDPLAALRALSAAELIALFS